MSAQMTFEDFAGSATPPAGVGPALLALWYDMQGDWERAHRLAQEEEGRNGDWVHAYLHRKEGDEGNANYWYARAGKSAASGDLDAEREAIARALLGG
jgi:hypothetical protein